MRNIGGILYVRFPVLFYNFLSHCIARRFALSVFFRSKYQSASCAMYWPRLIIVFSECPSNQFVIIFAFKNIPRALHSLPGKKRCSYLCVMPGRVTVSPQIFGRLNDGNPELRYNSVSSTYRLLVGSILISCSPGEFVWVIDVEASAAYCVMATVYILMDVVVPDGSLLVKSQILKR